MPHIVIDGQRIEAKQGQTVIQAAQENGIHIPHFCWHPELSISGNCRMCLVEVGLPRRLPNGDIELDKNNNPAINYFPKLQIACATYVSDGMHINTKKENVTEAQEAVTEFILINHPLDCPICDEAGQCKLQEYAFNHSTGQSRFEETKNPNPKRVSWGPNVLYDAERCISCSRCIRFAREIARQDVLTFVNRGDHVTIKLTPGAEFDNDYSTNVVDICPVGALTSKDFRFDARVWDMSFNPSICTACSRGCNIKLGIRNNEILRVDPVTNMYVNKYWICDHGRLTQYPKVNNDRITKPMIKDGEALRESDWNEAWGFAAEKIKAFKPLEIMFLGSAKATTEDNHILSKFAYKVIKTDNVDFLRHEDKQFADALLKTADKTPNAAGALEVGVFPGPKGHGYTQLAELIEKGRIKALYVMEDDFVDYPELFDTLDKLELLIVHASNHSELTKKADIVFATSAFAEIEGTFINVNKRVQHFTPAVATLDNIKTMGRKMSRLDKFGAHNDRWTQHEIRDSKQSWVILQGLANQLNAGWSYKNSSDLFEEISKRVISMRGMTYKKLDEYQGLTLGQADNPDKKIHNYQSHYMKP